MIAGLVLAGGNASRLGGGDKCLLPFGKTNLLTILLKRLAPQVSRLAISANGDPARFAAYGLPVLADETRNLGPLAGVLAGLDWAAQHGSTTLLTVPGDTPFIPTDLVTQLKPAPAYAHSFDHAHPLVALWPVAAAPALRCLLEQGEHRVMTAAECLSMRAEVFEDIPDPFFNINTQDDLDLAKKLYKFCK